MICEDWVAFGILAHEMFSEGEANGLEEQFLILYYKTACTHCKGKVYQKKKNGYPT